MIDFLFVGIRLRVRLAYAFCNHIRVALLMASELAIVTLHASRVLEKFSTQGAAHDVVELL